MPWGSGSWGPEQVCSFGEERLDSSHGLTHHLSSSWESNHSQIFTSDCPNLFHTSLLFHVLFLPPEITFLLHHANAIKYHLLREILPDFLQHRLLFIYSVQSISPRTLYVFPSDTTHHIIIVCGLCVCLACSILGGLLFHPWSLPQDPVRIQYFFLKEPTAQ